MILYSSPSSYYSMIARLALYESGASFNIRRMDIHLAKEQLSPWYLELNPAMTVPTLTDANESWTDSRTILLRAACIAGEQWYDADRALSTHIESIVDAHYAISIEHLTFVKAMIRFKMLRILFPRLLKRIIHQLEVALPSSTNPQATQNKILLNQERLAYFTEGSLSQKLDSERASVENYLRRLPTSPTPLLFGCKPCSADIVTTILCARLNMIGEGDSVKAIPALANWYSQMQTRPAFNKADIWTRFQPWRILLRY